MTLTASPERSVPETLIPESAHQDADPRPLVPVRSPASTVSVSMRVACLEPVAEVLPASRPIMSLSAHVQLDSGVIQTLSAEKSRPSVGSMMTVATRRSVFGQSASLDAGLTQTVHMTRHVSMDSVSHHVTSEACVESIRSADPSVMRQTAAVHPGLSLIHI